MNRKKGLLLVIMMMCALALSSCGSASPASSGENAAGSSPTEEQSEETPAKEDINPTVNEAIPETTGEKGRRRIDSDILELFGDRILSLPEEQLVYNESGLLESVLTTNYNDEIYNAYEFDYDSSGRVEEIREYHDTSGNPTMIYSFERNVQGAKTHKTTQLIQADGSYAVTSYMDTEYDEAGNRIFDYWYTSDSERQDTYTAYLYNESGLRTELQRRATDTDEVMSSEVYEYNENGQLTDVYTYQGGLLIIHDEYIYDADGFHSWNRYDASGNSMGTSYRMFLPACLYELIDTGF